MIFSDLAPACQNLLIVIFCVYELTYADDPLQHDLAYVRIAHTDPFGRHSTRAIPIAGWEVKDYEPLAEIH